MVSALSRSDAFKKPALISATTVRRKAYNDDADDYDCDDSVDEDDDTLFDAGVLN